MHGVAQVSPGDHDAECAASSSKTNISAEECTAPVKSAHLQMHHYIVCVVSCL